MHIVRTEPSKTMSLDTVSLILPTGIIKRFLYVSSILSLVKMWEPKTPNMHGQSRIICGQRFWVTYSIQVNVSGVDKLMLNAISGNTKHPPRPIHNILERLSFFISASINLTNCDTSCYFDKVVLKTAFCYTDF